MNSFITTSESRRENVPATFHPHNGTHRAGNLFEEASQLIFSVAGELYACPVTNIERLLRRQDVELIPRAADDVHFLEGAFNLDGEAIPSISLRALWELPDARTSAENGVWLVVREGQERFALAADGCRGVVKALPSSERRFQLPERLMAGHARPFAELIPWQGQLLVTVSTGNLFTPEQRQKLQETVNMKYKTLIQDSRMEEFRLREARLLCKPTVEGYLQLATDYNAIGLGKESERLILAAESLENGSGQQRTDHLFSGVASAAMLGEVLQILQRLQRTGELIVESPGQTFRVYLDHGEIINATSLNQPAGVPSFVATLGVKQGSYRFTERDQGTVERTIHQTTGELLLTAFQMIDEQLQPVNQ